MTRNQVAYGELVERRRSNQETARHNLADEGIRRSANSIQAGALAESIRHNQSTEDLNFQNLSLQGKHYASQDYAAQQQADASMRQATAALDQAAAAQQNAGINSRNATTREGELEVKQGQLADSIQKTQIMQGDLERKAVADAAANQRAIERNMLQAAGVIIDGTSELAQSILKVGALNG